MQILKDEVRNAILREARREFLESGYKNASIRRIAERAGLSAGNLYRYFKNKDDLFSCVVQPAIDCVKKMSEHEMLEMADFTEAEIGSLIELQAGEIIENLIKYRAELLIVLNQSEGTCYQNVKSDLINHYTEHINDHLALEKIKTDNEKIKYIPHAVSVSMIEGMLSIISNNDTDELIGENLKIYFSFIVKEFIQIMNSLRRL